MPDLSVADVARILNIREETVRSRIRRGELDAVQDVSGAWVIHWPDAPAGAPVDTASGSASAPAVPTSAPAPPDLPDRRIPRPFGTSPAASTPAVHVVPDLAVELARAHAVAAELRDQLVRESGLARVDAERIAELQAEITAHDAEAARIAAALRADLAVLQARNDGAQILITELRSAAQAAERRHGELLALVASQAAELRRLQESQAAELQRLRESQDTESHEMRILLMEALHEVRRLTEAQALDPEPEPAEPEPRRPWWRIW